MNPNERLQWRHPEFCFRGAKDTFPNIGGANHGFAVIKSQILQVLKHPSPPCCDATVSKYVPKYLDSKKFGEDESTV